MPLGVDEKYFGYDGFIWFFGVVEDLNDPEEVSRVRVRVIGHNPKDKKIVPTEDLPWAPVMMPTTSASVSGIGHSHGLMLGSYVFGFYLDGKYAQQPMVIGTWHGIPQLLSNPNEGFNDPSGEFPRTVDEPDTNKLARGINTIQDYQDLKIDVPASPFNAVYPNNKVYETQSGHIVEVDDTIGSERIRVYHQSGTFVEMHPNGDIVQSNKNRWQITTGNDKAHVTGNVTVFVDGNTSITVTGNVTQLVEEGDVTQTVAQGSVVQEVTIGDVTQTVAEGSVVQEVTVGDVTQIVGGNVDQTVKGNVKGLVEGSVTLDISQAATVTVPETTWTGNITLGGNLTQTGSYTLTGTATATGDFVSAGISGKGHTHLAGTPPGSTGTPQ